MRRDRSLSGMEKAIPNNKQLNVECAPAGDGWECNVRVGNDAGATRHRVTVTRDEMARFAPGQTTPDRLVEASFGFLLEREPRESILRSFELSAIERYFASYPREISARL